MKSVSLTLGASTLTIECGRIAKQANGSAFVRYGDTGHPNLHYCDWIRDWTDTCLRIFGTISVKNPEFLEKFAERKAL